MSKPKYSAIAHLIKSVQWYSDPAHDGPWLISKGKWTKKEAKETLKDLANSASKEFDRLKLGDAVETETTLEYVFKPGPLIHVPETPSMRDMFAMSALQGLLAAEAYDDQYTIEGAAEIAYMHADAMLKARKP